MPEKYGFKVLLIGPNAVGKTSLLHRYVKGFFNEQYILTIGVDLLTKEIKINKDKIELLIWDIGGQKKFKFLHERFYKGTQGALLIFDLSREKTFKEMEEWFSEAYKILKIKIPILLIGNKSDLIDDIGDAIDPTIAHKFADDKGSIYIETSAKTGQNVEEAFNELAIRMIDFWKKYSESN